ncbi:MAG: cardiolipin synthase [Sulfurovaceae bacterium]|nr:cardiolipin synthase [Sulfurovaceae bacterium]
MSLITVIIVIHYIIVTYAVYRAMMRPHREPASRLAWVIVAIAIPIVGIILYFMFGETSIGFIRAKNMQKLKSEIFQNKFKATLDVTITDTIPKKYHHIFRMGQSINGFMPTGGNQHSLLKNSEDMIESLVRDIDNAKQHIHILFYIWFADDSGRKIANALMRASNKGVMCRVLVDAVGSRKLISSNVWKDMRKSGVHVASSLSIGNMLLRMILGRVDLRNHRKIVVIDNRITYCGSQNCADANFYPEDKYAFWVDAVVRFTGPIALQNQHLFVQDWLAATREYLPPTYESEQPKDIIDLTNVKILEDISGKTNRCCPAQVVGTGPTERHDALSDIFQVIISSARQNLTITTPYFVPNEPVLNAICSVARMGVVVKLILSHNADSWFVRAASHSYYPELLEAGVEIYEYQSEVLHSKLLTIDGELGMIGSANLDRRSFDLNYENNIIFYDQKLTKDILERQQVYINKSMRIAIEEVNSWSKPNLLWYNINATMSPLL